LPALLTALHLAWVRLSEHPVRALGLIITLGVTVLAWMVLAALASPFLAFSAGEAINTQLGITNARSGSDVIPLRYARRIEQISGVREVTYTTIAAFFCKDEKIVLPVIAEGGSGITSTMQRYGASPADIALWNETRNGLLIDADIAHQCGLTPGMTVSPKELFSGVKMPFHIVALIPNNPDSTNSKHAYGHYDYINQMIPESLRDQIRFLSVTGNDPTRLPQLAETIEREFASADPPLEANVSSETSSLLGRFGQVQSLLGLVMAAMAASALLVFLTILAHQIAQRRASMATLQTIGFGRSLQFGGLILELFLIIITGTVLGLLAGRATLAAITPQVFWLTGQLRTPDWALWSLAPALVLLALLTLAWPALQVAKLKPIDHLRV